MKTLVIETPSMYADHHVCEARRILLELSGVKGVYASSAFHAVEVEYDPKLTDQDLIKAVLEPTGYLNELPSPAETGIAMTKEGGRMYARHSAHYTQTGQAVSFKQLVGNPTNASLACPGMGVLSMED